MKLTNFQVHSEGWYIDIFKFKRRSLIEIASETCITKNPSILIQIGPDEILDISLGLGFAYLSFRIWSRHFDD